MQVVVFSCKLVSGKQRLQFQFLPNIFPALSVAQWGVVKRVNYSKNKLASLEATLVRNSAHPLTYSLTDLLTGVKCRATSVAKK